MEHGIPKTPEMVVALMQKVGSTRDAFYPCKIFNIICHPLSTLLFHIDKETKAILVKMTKFFSINFTIITVLGH